MASSAFESGKAILTTLGEGISTAVTVPYNAAKSALSVVRNLLPFSDAKEGPLSGLSKSGMALAETFGQGISKAASIPAQAMQQMFSTMGKLGQNVAVPSMLAGTLALTPMVIGNTPKIAETHQVGIERQEPLPVPLTHTQSTLLAETRGSLNPAVSGSTESNRPSIDPMLEAILSKLDANTERPIHISIMLDGRQVAQAVYKDIRERKIRNYETL